MRKGEPADLSSANLSRAYFQPKSLPDIRSIATASGLSTLHFDQPAAIVELRDALKKNGFRRQEREVTFALNRVRERDFTPEGGFRYVLFLEAAFRFVFFEVTCQWGMWPGLALWILLVLMGVFSLPYMFALSLHSKIFGIWRIWATERVLKQFGSDEPERLQLPKVAVGYRATRIPIWQVPLWALYLSVLSAFHFGWKDLNVGSWIARVQHREYTLGATGWVRVVSGVQSLLSVYLLALWALTYFGRPFG